MRTVKGAGPLHGAPSSLLRPVNGVNTVNTPRPAAGVDAPVNIAVNSRE